MLGGQVDEEQSSTMLRGARLSSSLSGTNHERAADYNLRTVLQAVRLNPGATRVDIARQVGLTAPAVANISGRLIEQGLLRVERRKDGGRGQPALQMEIDPDGAFGVGINVDRDHLTLVTLDLAGVVRSRVTREVAFALPKDVGAFLNSEVLPALAAGGIDPGRVLGAGVAIPDDIGRIALPDRPQAYDAWLDASLPVVLAPHLPWRLHFENDAVAAALGEAEYGIGFDKPTFFYLLISAGLGGGVVVDRHCHRGATTRSGEIGLMPDASVGRRGAIVQDTVSLSVLFDRLRSAGHEVAGVAGLALLEGGAREVADAWLVEVVRSLVQPIVAVNCLIDPDAVLIGGRLPMEFIRRIASSLKAELSRLDLPSLPPIMPAQMAQDASAIGAAMLPFLHHLLPSDAILMTSRPAP